MADEVITAPAPVAHPGDGAPASAPAEARTGPSPSAPTDSTTDWRAGLPELLRKEKSLETFKNPEALAQSFVELKKMQGRMVQLPGPDAKPEQVAAFREKLGVPKAPSDYVFETPEDIQLDPGRLEHFRGIFHRVGLSAEQAKALVSAYAEDAQHQHDRIRQEYKQQAEALKQEWGDQTFARRTTQASRAVQMIGDPQLVEFLEVTGAGDHPAMIKLMARVGEIFAEHGYIDGRTDGPSQQDALARIREIRADRRHPAMDPQHPQHKQAHEALLDLYKVAHPVAYGER